MLALAGCRETTAGIAGTWVLHLENHPLIVLTLEESGGTVSGTLSRPATMTFDGLTFSAIGNDIDTDAVSGTVQDDGALRIVATDLHDPADQTELAFTITSPNTARMALAGAPFEPFRLTRHEADGRPDVWTAWDSRRSYPLEPPFHEPNPEMAAIYNADQADRRSFEAFEGDAARIAAADKERRERTRALLKAGELRAGEDFRRAALVFQHGDAPEDFLLAHTLALVALARGDRSAAWIAAATLDRYLRATQQPQIYGTQFSRDGVSQEPFNRALISDALRQELGVPALANQQEQMQTILNREGR